MKIHVLAVLTVAHTAVAAVFHHRGAASSSTSTFAGEENKLKDVSLSSLLEFQAQEEKKRHKKAFRKKGEQPGEQEADAGLLLSQETNLGTRQSQQKSDQQEVPQALSSQQEPSSKYGEKEKKKFSFSSSGTLVNGKLSAAAPKPSEQDKNHMKNDANTKAIPHQELQEWIEGEDQDPTVSEVGVLKPTLQKGLFVWAEGEDQEVNK